MAKKMAIDIPMLMVLLAGEIGREVNATLFMGGMKPNNHDQEK